MTGTKIVWRLLALTLLVVPIGLTGCGGGESSSAEEDATLPRGLREVRVSLNRYVGPEHAGLLMAEANGYFADVGLKVVLDPPGGPRPPILYLLSKLIDSDFSVSHQPQVVIAAENRRPIVSVGSLIASPTAAFIWLKGSGIESVSDLKGKTIAVPGLRFQVSFLESLLARAGLKLEDVKVRSVGYDAVPDLVDGHADAIFGGSSQLEGIELRSLGREPVITPVRSMGIPSYEELVLIATDELASEEPDLIRGFMSALSRGTAAATREPLAVVNEIERHIEPSPVSSRKAREAQVAAILPLLSEGGYMDPEQAERLIAWMHAEGMIEDEPSVAELLSNEFLSPEG